MPQALILLLRQRSCTTSRRSIQTQSWDLTSTISAQVDISLPEQRLAGYFEKYKTFSSLNTFTLLSTTSILTVTEHVTLSTQLPRPHHHAFHQVHHCACFYRRTHIRTVGLHSLHLSPSLIFILGLHTLRNTYRVPRVQLLLVTLVRCPLALQVQHPVDTLAHRLLDLPARRLGATRVLRLRGLRVHRPAGIQPAVHRQAVMLVHRQLSVHHRVAGIPWATMVRILPQLARD
jgi:hypothetical protein